MNDFLKIIFTNIFIFVLLLIMARILGKKQLSQLTFFNYITGITLGSIVADALNILNSNYDEIVSLLCWTIFTVITAFIALKSPRLRVIIDGEPTILIKRGMIQRKALKRLGINMDDLLMMLRNKNIFNIKDAYYAILEPDGKLSVLKDINKFIPTELIVDGNLVKKNLKELNIDEKWLTNKLKEKGIENYKDILYLELQSDGSFYIDKGE